MRRERKGKLFVVSAPSGGGKTTLCNKLLKEKIGLLNSVSMTTRPPRRGEKKGFDYNFVSRKRFQEMIAKRGFLEYESNFGHLYGTPKRFIEKNLTKGRSILLSIDVKGAMKVKRAYPRDSVLIFMLPPSIKILKKRLSLRMSDSAAAIDKRLRIAEKELSYKNRYDYRIVNDNLAKAYDRLRCVVVSELETLKGKHDTDR